MPTLHIRLLGEFTLTYASDPVSTLNQARQQSLLAYLLLHCQAPHPRQHLAFLFWPDSSEAQARTNLRQLLHDLRHALPDAEHFLGIDTQTIQWRSDASFTLDVADFEHALDQAKSLRGSDLMTVLAQAATLYAGPFLPACYDDWVLPERERLHQRFVQVLERLIGLLEEHRAYPAAIGYAQRLLRDDPLHEATYLRLMRLCALNGDRPSALRIYHTCATLLQHELGVEPNAEIQKAYQRLLNMDAPIVTHRVATPVAISQSTLVGRQSEWQTLQAAWRRASAGQAHFVLISGEAGIGKTRLAEEMLEWASQQGLTTAHTRAYAAEGSLAYVPVIEWLRKEALQTALVRLDSVWLSEIARLLPELLTEHPDLPRPEPLMERWQRQRMFEALARAVLSARPPLLLMIDDLQWCDQETLEWLHYLLHFATKTHLLVIGTVRPEEITQEHPLTSLLLNLRSAGQVTEIELGPLDGDQTAALAAQEAEHALNPELAQQLYQATEGNPLFIIETIRTGAWNEATDSQPIQNLQSKIQNPSLPAKVQAVIQRRLAQLTSTAHDLAQLAGTVGRSFTFDLVAQASELEEDTLVRALDELWQRRIIRERGTNAYDFSHDRIREVAYAAISPARRRHLHRRLAQVLETIYAAALDTVGGQLATHYEQAGLFEKAIFYHQQAMEAAQRLYAEWETVEHAHRALALLKTLPASTEAKHQQILLLLILAAALDHVRGSTALEIEEIYHQAEALAQEINDASLLYLARQGLLTVLCWRGEWLAAHEMALHNLQLAQTLHDPLHLRRAVFLQGLARFYLGEFASAHAYYQQAANIYMAEQADDVNDYGTTLTILCRTAQVLWYLGFADQAYHMARSAVSRARKLYGPYGVAWALNFTALICQYRGEVAAVETYAQELQALADKYGFPDYSPMGTILDGWALTERGETTAGLALLRQALAPLRVKQVGSMLPYQLALLAEAMAQSGEYAEGLVVIQEALALIERTGNRYWQAEFYRLRGQLLLGQGATASETEVCYRQAVEIARQQGAKFLELRATISLARLWQEHGGSAEARRILAEIYDWFTEGFDTADLREANRLLEQLA